MMKRHGNRQDGQSNSMNALRFYRLHAASKMQFSMLPPQSHHGHHQGIVDAVLYSAKAQRSTAHFGFGYSVVLRKFKRHTLPYYPRYATSKKIGKSGVVLRHSRQIATIISNGQSIMHVFRRDGRKAAQSGGTGAVILWGLGLRLSVWWSVLRNGCSSGQWLQRTQSSTCRYRCRNGTRAQKFTDRRLSSLELCMTRLGPGQAGSALT